MGACSSVRWRKKALMRSCLSMASSVVASPPRLYSPILTNSSTSAYFGHELKPPRGPLGAHDVVHHAAGRGQHVHRR